jgi:hypothetical protein
VRISLPISVRVVHAVGRSPFDRAALQRQRAANREKVFDCFRNLITTMRQQTMIAHAYSQAPCDPVKQDTRNYCRPTPEKERGDGADMKSAKKNSLAPIYVSFSRH